MATQITRPGSRAEIAQVVASLQEVLGQRIVAAMTGTENLTVIESWVRGDAELPPEVASRVTLAWEAVELLLEVEQPSVIRAFFGGLNPLLGERPPALVLAEDPEAFRRAVREFRAYG